MHGPTRQSGVTLLEMAIAVAVTVSLIGAVLTIGVETASFASYADEDFSTQFEANRSFESATAALRKTGWSELSGTDYPRVSVGGDELEFRLLTDTDGNGHPFDGATGELEWDDTVYTLRRDAVTGMLGVYDGTTLLRTIGRYIESVTFETNVQDPALHRREIRIAITATRPASDGSSITYTAAGSVHMRN